MVDEALHRAALAQGLEADPRLTVVHRAAGRRDALDVVRPRTADVLVVDDELADGTGVELGLALQARDPGLAVLLLAGHDAPDLVLALRDRVPRPWGLVSRRSCAGPAALAHAVVAAADGQVVLLVAAAPQPAAPDRSAPASPAGLPHLTPGRRAVLALVAQGLSNRAAGRVLGLSPRSVENHLAAVYRDLDVAGPDVNPRVLAALAYRSRSRGAAG